MHVPDQPTSFRRGHYCRAMPVRAKPPVLLGVVFLIVSKKL